ncbi:hypothetical protein BS78_03G255400 [Paspalum vaginatum]|nr:hypothetical protein BS78_03G255400 [Paspalum vaginatum]
MLLRLTCTQPAASAAVRWRPPERARPGRRFPVRHAAISAANGAGAPSSLLRYDPLADLLGPDVEVEPTGSHAQSTAPTAEKGKPRSWVGPNGQYYRELPCPSCRGRGYTPRKECGIDRSSLDCPMCDGKGIQMCLHSPLKVKEDDEVDKLEIKINTPKRSKRTYVSPSPEVAMKISRSLKSLNAQTGLFSKHMKIIHQDPELRAQRIATIKRTKGTAAARKHASEIQKAFFSDPENRLKRSIDMKGVKFYCSKCVRKGSARARFRCRLCVREGHNSRTCGKPKSENEQQRQPRHCSRCGEKGHNRRNCPRSTEVGTGASGYMVNKLNGSNSAIYSCSFCLEKGHNS